jgi:hypothetical protein
MSTCRCGCTRLPAPGRLGFTRACYQRFLLAGRPDVLPPPRWTWPGGTREGRIEDYQWLRDEQDAGRSAAAERLDVCQRTTYRYDAAIKAAAA